MWNGCATTVTSLPEQDLVERLETGEVPVEDRDVRPHPEEGPRGRLARDAGPDDDDLRGRDAGHAADQLPVPAGVVLQEVRRDLRGHPAADLAERLEDRERAVGELDLLVGDGGDLLLEEDVDLRPGGPPRGRGSP